MTQSSAFILGQEVEKFEQEFASYVEAKHCIAVNSGTSALSAGIYYPLPIHRQAAYAHLDHPLGNLENTEQACERVLCLPISPEITHDEVRYVGETLAELVARKN